MRDYCGRGWPISRRLEYRSVPEPNTGCLLWTASVDGCGYGTIRCGEKVLRAHRVAWEVENGPIPDGLLVCHTCDTPCCINTKHLYLGTDQTNMEDRAARWRGYRNGSTLPFGVTRRENGRFRARVRIHNKTYNLGHFDTAEEAGAAATRLKEKLLRELCHSFPPAPPSPQSSPAPPVPPSVSEAAWSPWHGCT